MGSKVNIQIFFITFFMGTLQFLTLASILGRGRQIFRVTFLWLVGEAAGVAALVVLYTLAMEEMFANVACWDVQCSFIKPFTAEGTYSLNRCSVPTVLVLGGSHKLVEGRGL